MLSPADFYERVALPPGHVLRLIDQRVAQAVHKGGCQRDVYWFRQLDGCRRVVAHYRVWVEQELAAPYTRRVGWEQFSTSGKLLDRETYRSQPPRGRLLH